MAAATARKTISIYDYPEHLNPFYEEDNHNKIRFWTLNKKINRSNSINFSGLKELKKSWAFRSFLKKGKKSSEPPPPPAPEPTPKPKPQLSEDSSPIMFRRAMLYSSMSKGQGVRSPYADRYEYGGSMTPLPKTRFQERLRSPSNYDMSTSSFRMETSTPRMARSEFGDSRFSIESTNPFDEPVPPVRASRRKKKRAAPLPPNGADISITSTESEARNTTNASTDKDTSLVITEKDLQDIPNFELKIVEDEETKPSEPSSSPPPEPAVPAVKPNGEILTKHEVTNHTEVTNNVEVTTNHVEQTTHTHIDDIKHIDEDEDVIVRTKVITQAQETPKKIKNEIQTRGVENKTTEDIKIVEDKNVSVRVKETKEQIEDSDEEILPKISFSKIDIGKYRRNSSLNEDDIKLRRDYQDHHNETKRSKSLTNNLNSTTVVTFDINLNEEKEIKANDWNENEQPQKFVCKLYDEPVRKHSLDNSISSTEKEFIEIDKATKELEREIRKLNSALKDDEIILSTNSRMSVSDIKKKFDNNNSTSTFNNLSPNPIPKPKRSNYGSNSSVNGNVHVY